jgi:hypothetical protein
MRIERGVIHSRRPGRVVEISGLSRHLCCVVLAPTGSGHTVSARQASRSYESHALTRDVSQESLELRDALCFQNEFSGIDWIIEGYYKFFAEAKPACRSTTHLE